MTKKKNNTFKFAGFRERLEAIRVDTIFLKRRRDADDIESYFLEKLEEWSDLNGTLHFDDFKKSIPRSNLNTYAQVLHLQKPITDALIHHLNVEDSLCMPALLDLSIGAYRDLQQDFRPYFWDFFDVVQKVLLKAAANNDVDLLEKCFAFYAHLFRNKHSTGQLELILERFLPLVAHKRDYVRKFAAESISYLVRKHEDFTSFLNFCCEKVDCGRATNECIAELIFQAMQSVKKTLHTSACEFYENVLEKCASSTNSETSGCQVSLELNRKLAFGIKSDDLVQLLPCLISKMAGTPQSVARLENLFENLLIWTQNKRLNLLYAKCDQIFDKILKPTIENFEFVQNSKKLLSLLLKVIEVFIVESKGKVPEQKLQHIFKLLLRKLPNDDDSFDDVLFEFFESLIDCSNFNLLWPTLQDYFENRSLQNERILEFYCKLCDESNLDEPDSVECIRSESLILEFTSNSYCRNSKNLFRFVMQFLSNHDDLTVNRDKMLACLFLIPHFPRIDENLLKKVFDNVVEGYDKDQRDLEFLNFSMILLIRCVKIFNIDVKELEFGTLFGTLKKNLCELLTLNLLHWLLNVFPSFSFGKLSKEEALSLLQDNLLSPYQRIRVKTLQILSIYEQEGCETNFPSLALKCERISLDLQNYRERIRIYTKLSASEYETLLPKNGDLSSFKALTIKFLLGQLNVNFTLLTPALNQTIETHARLQTSTDFWEIFGQVLSLAYKNVASSTEKYRTFELSASVEEKSEFRESLIQKLSKCDETALENDLKDLIGKMASNFANFRLLLWKTMENFADLAQSKSRFLSEFILNLAEEELCLTCKNGRTDNLLIDASDGNEDSDEKSKDVYKNQVAGRQLMTLISCLTVYSKFNDIKNIAREKQLKALYYQLLMHGRPDVQRAALDCILAYKSKPLEPYSSHLSGLLNDKQFKDELIIFNVDSEAHILEMEHRAEVMPVLLRLLYGRLLGKGSNENRKRQIYRFLASCQANELSTFLDYLFAPLEDILLKEDILQNCYHVQKEYDFSKSIGFRKIKGILIHLSSVIKHLGFSLSNAYRSKLLRICLILGSIFGKIQSEKQHIRAHFVKMNKKLRNELITRITEFCEHFENYPFESSEIEAFFSYCLTHVTEKSENFALLSNEILKLCLVWSGIPRFFPLLAIYLSHKTDKTMLELLIESLNDENLQTKSRDLICQIIFNLITTADFSPEKLQSENSDEPEPGPMLQFSSHFSRKIVDENMQLNFGTQILLPYSNILLEFIGRKCAGAAGDKRSGKSPPTLCRNEKWMKILQVLTESAPKAENAVQLLTILFDVLKAKTVKNPAIEADLVKSVDCLLRSVDDKIAFLPNVIECFLSINNRQSRESLITLFNNLMVQCSTLKDISDMVNDLNSWNPKRLDEPDYDRRLVAFSKFNKLLKNDQNISSGQFSDIHCWLMANNCLYTVVQVDDMSLRDNAGHSLRLLVEYLHQKYDENENRAFLTLKILPCIKDNLKSRNDAVRNELMNLLGCCVKYFPNHPKLIGLFELSDISDPDQELNFFENVTHIQTHRKVRAIRRICEKLENSESTIKVHSEVLFNFVWPICYSFIFDPVYASNSALIGESVRFLAAYCKKASWKRYNAMLKYYLQKLRKDVERQKLLVKIIVSILDSFHFDIKNLHMLASENEDTAAEESTVNVDGTIIQTSGSKRKIFDVINKEFIPQLQNCLVMKTSTDKAHKTMKNKVYDEDEEILRVPLALALIKLLQKLGDKYLEMNLSNILVKICQMLKSRSFDIRETTRKILCSSAQCLGPVYLPYVVKEMKEILTRGYQVHVLTFTVHVLLDAMVDKLVPGDLDSCLNELVEDDVTWWLLLHVENDVNRRRIIVEMSEIAKMMACFVRFCMCLFDLDCHNIQAELVLQTIAVDQAPKCIVHQVFRTLICNNDLFGAIADQKEVDEITRNLKEAKSNKTLATYKILGRLVSDHRLNSIIGPLKNILEEKFSHKMVTRVNDALKHIAQGLILNSNLNSEFLMIFVHQILTENVEKMNLGSESSQNSGSENKIEEKSYRPQSCLLIDPAPPRIGVGQNPNISKSKTQGLHVLLIFACEILDNLLKNQQTNATQYENSGKFYLMLDPFIGILLQCLKAKQTKVVSVSMRCLNHMIKFPLQSWETLSGSLMTQLFVLLSRFAGLGSACKGENGELLSILFKTLTTVIRELDCATLTIKQLKILLTYIEADLCDSQKQTTAFNLLKAILHRKLSCPEIRQIITILEKLAIESQNDSVREQSRLVIKFYMQNYPSGLKARTVHKCLKFFCAQLQYEYESGRDSALEMLSLLINDVDENGHFKSLALFLFVHLGSQLVDDESSKIRRKAADVLKTLFRKVDDQSILNSMVQMIFDWLNGDELAHKKLAAQLLALLAVDKQLMDANLVKKSLDASSNVLENLSIKYKLLDDEEQEEAQQKSLIDHIVYLILVFFEKLFAEQTNLIRETNLRSLINRIWEQILKLLDHPHVWVQYSTCRLIGSFLGCYKPEEIFQCSMSKPSTSSNNDYLLENCRPVIKTLCLSFIQRLRMTECKADLAEQIIKNIVFLGRCIRLISKEEGYTSVQDSDKDYRASLKWLTVQMGRICRFEIAQYKDQNLRRNNVFKWFASLILDCDDEELEHILPIVLPNLHREMSLTDDADETLKLLASEIVELIKSKIGVEKFFAFWSKAQTNWSEKRLERKRNMALEAVNEPEKASKRKILKQKNKKVSKKRKFANPMERRSKRFKSSG